MTPEVDRLFFALWPEDTTRAALAESAAGLRRRLHPVGRWIGAHRYHLTLHFLGDYPVFPEAIAARAAAAAACVQAAPFTLRLDQAASFRNRSIPWWIGPGETPPALKALWRALREQMVAHAVPYDAKLGLKPHVTVLRDAGQPLAVTPLPPVDWAVDRFVLVHSHLGAQSAYRLLGAWPLTARAVDTAAPPPVIQRDLWDT